MKSAFTERKLVISQFIYKTTAIYTAVKRERNLTLYENRIFTYPSTSCYTNAMHTLNN